MKNLIKKIIIWKLDILAKMYLWRFKPDIIAITGNVGKTSTKEAVTAVLSKTKKVRSGKGNLNNEFGVPLTVIGDWADSYYEAGNSFWFWCKVLLVSFFKFFFIFKYPEVLVLEYGADKPGDISRLVHKYKPKIGIVTAVGDIPVHVEYFSDPDGVAREKSKLVSMLRPADYAILNHDDSMVYDMKEKTKAKVTTFGFTEGADVGLSNFNFRLDDNQKPEGVLFKISTWGSHLPAGRQAFVPAIIHGVLGKSQAFAAGAATCVGLIYDMNLIEVSEALSNYKSPKGRLKILKGIKNTIIIDDTYNAAPASMHLALDTLRELPGKRKIAILGDMLELGKYTVEAHEAVGNLAGSIADILVTVGARGKFIAYSAENQMDSKNIYSFVSSNLAKLKVQELTEEGDLILVKGSQGVRMEKIVEEIMAEPLRKKELLVRQGKKWLRSR
ncbi:MAG: hypothetical protein A3B86_01590 [Candidatus Yanofskybacteria bacterium RIFCSPHIGHO2_02_FULL_38_22b]|uniref:UDP-N-acetylmuramoyl-tripeptide--D-alanyl-D-alanine ligase n=1 Tax=Candidatus Yanofskybacteria bacterium RIFCSPHIGHO2_02_FULL_38_22b TaxID=1802673 RepID=A0A1F8F2S6_9BACT|nr:MAG: hypothetical protein A3B86_01590 [Candidatus Yanofskybacteria bacterium RIFCSPHIGHO2_02_FULL_38_22b]OGN19818.1 MAG: hypothetical protein A2910_02040 [Candidatus Yanofskybacteria bacterium RIFCSPLOWO2_01_FULL_39_28]